MIAREAAPQFARGRDGPHPATDDAAREIAALRDRLVRLSKASLRISESLDLHSVLQGVIDSALSLTDARYGGISTVDDAGLPMEFVTSGITPEEYQALADTPDGPLFLQYLLGLPETLRVADMLGHFRSLGLPEFQPPLPAKSFMATPLRNQGRVFGVIYLANAEDGREFSPEDEETLLTFASQAAMVIANAERYRQEQQARADLEALVDTSPVGVLIFDAKTRDLLSRNRETLRIVRGLHSPGRSLADLLSVMTFRRPDGREITADQLPTERAIRTGETVRAEEIVIHLPDGHTVTTVVNATPIFSNEGEVVSVVATMQDMTPLEELERLRAEFLSMVSQELRRPLTAIKGSAAAVLSSASPVDPIEMRQFFHIVDEQADQMRRHISNLLDVTRIEAGSFTVVTEPTDLASMVEQARSEFQRGGARNGFDVQIPPDLPRVRADRQRILQVLDNLYSNASRSSPDGSTITVRAALEDVHVAVSVTDEGRGVSQERLPHLFLKYFRLDGETPDMRPEGEGLALAICKGIVEAHGGRIRAESGEQGLGTRFLFTVPTVEEADREPAPGQPSAAPGRSDIERVRILVADGEPQVLRLVRSALSQAGYAPVVTGNPNDVESLIETERPHLVLLDLLMRRVFELTDAPVIILSSRDRDQDVVRAFAAGADDYIVKPFSPGELSARITAALRKQGPSRRDRGREPYVLGDLAINYAERRVTVAGRQVELTATEYSLLFELSTNAGRVLTHDQLLRRVWGPNYAGDSQPVRTFVKNLRRKLRDPAGSPNYIFTQPRVGYRMPKPEDQGR